MNWKIVRNRGKKNKSRAKKIENIDTPVKNRFQVLEEGVLTTETTKGEFLKCGIFKYKNVKRKLLFMDTEGSKMGTEGPKMLKKLKESREGGQNGIYYPAQNYKGEPNTN